MSDLTLEEKTNGAKNRAAEKVAEKHFFDAGQPHFPLGFSICNRNKGHWDIFAKQAHGKVSAFLSLDEGNKTSGRDGQSEKAFRIRGEAPNVVIFDERWNPHGRDKPPHFRSVMGAMLWICEELMQEPERGQS